MDVVSSWMTAHPDTMRSRRPISTNERRHAYDGDYEDTNVSSKNAESGVRVSSHSPGWRLLVQMTPSGPLGPTSALANVWARRITLARGSRGLFVVVKDDVRRGWLHAELAEHADDLAAVQRAVIHHVDHD